MVKIANETFCFPNFHWSKVNIFDIATRLIWNTTWNNFKNSNRSQFRFTDQWKVAAEESSGLEQPPNFVKSVWYAEYTIMPLPLIVPIT